MKKTIIVIILLFAAVLAPAQAGSIFPDMSLRESLYFAAGTASVVGAIITSVILPYTFDSKPSPYSTLDIPPFFSTALVDACFAFSATLCYGKAFGASYKTTFKSLISPPQPEIKLDFTHLQPISINPLIDTLIFSEAYLNF